jgi:hypothetical protein
MKFNDTSPVSRIIDVDWSETTSRDRIENSGCGRFLHSAVEFDNYCTYFTSKFQCVAFDRVHMKQSSKAALLGALKLGRKLSIFTNY